MRWKKVLDDSVKLSPVFGNTSREKFTEIMCLTERSDNLIHDFMQEEFGEKAHYVEFLFYEHLRVYEPVINYIGQAGDIEYLRYLAKKFCEKEQGKK